MTQVAEGIGVTRQTLSKLVMKTGISTKMVIRLFRAFGSTSETWPGVQRAYDLWQAHVRTVEINIGRFETA